MSTSTEARTNARGWTAVAAAALLGIAALAGACNGDDNGDETDGGAGATQTAPASVQPPETDFATPEVDGRVYTFAPKGYEITAPDGWNPRPNHVFDPAGSRYPHDVFFHPDIVDDVQASIAIACLMPRDTQATSELFHEARVAQVTQFADSDVASRELVVAGVQAYALDYRQTLRERTGEPITNIERTDIVFVEGECRWMISFTAPAGQRDAYQDAFDEALQSFRFLS